MDNIITIGITGIYLNIKILSDEKYYLQQIDFIKMHYLPQEIQFLEFIFSRLYKADFQTKKLDKLTFEEIQQKYSDPTEIPDQDTPVKNPEKESAGDFSDLNRQNSSFFEEFSDPPEVSDPRLTSRRDAWKRVGEYLQQGIIDAAIWISKINRDHNINPNGKISSDGDLFKSLCKRYDPDFGNGSRFFTLVHAVKGYSFSLQLNATGHLLIWIKSKTPWHKFLEHFYAEFKFLKFDEWSELLQSFEYNLDRIFILETANAVGDRKVIDATLKGACLLVKKVYFRGQWNDIKIKIDFSEGDPEIEFIGPEGPTRVLQDIVARPIEFVNSLGYVEDQIESNLDSTLAILQNQNDLGLQISKNHDEIKGQIQEVKTQGSEQNLALVQIIKENQIAISERLDDQTGEIQAVNESINFMGTEQIQAIEHHNHINTLDHIHLEKKIDRLNRVTERGFDELARNITIIDDKIDSTNVKFKNNLYLVLRAIEKVPGKTMKQLLDELKIPQQTLYRYLAVLQNNNLIESEKEDNLKKGRPKRKFFRK